MKKQIIAIMLGMTMVIAMAGCGSTKNETTENSNTTEAAGSTTTESASNYTGTPSAQMNVVPADYVTELCDFSAVPVTIAKDYEVSDENVNDAVMELINGYGLGNKPVTDRTVVEPGDLVNVDYTGFQDGEAFSGGTATDVLIDVSNNKDAVRGTGYIDGFSDGLIGAEVGSTIDCDVKFPDNYGVDTLNGQTVVFQFVVNGIYAPATFDEIEDATIEENFGADYGITSKEGLVDFVKQYMDASRYSAIVTKVKDYVLANSTFELPEDYMIARLAEYEQTYAEAYCKDGETLADYFMNNYSMTLEDAEAELIVYLDEQVSIEFAFAVIADKIDVQVDETEYAAYVQNFIDNGNMGFTTEEDVFNYFGAGSVEDGQYYLTNLYRVNKAIDYVAENAVVSYE